MSYKSDKEKKGETAKDSLRSVIIFMSHNTSFPILADFGKKTLNFMDQYKYNIKFTEFLEKFLQCYK